MAYEVEYKAAVFDAARFRLRLAELGAEKTSSVLEVDRYLAHPCRDFAATDEALRIRQTWSGDDLRGDGGLRVTYKGPRHAGPTRTRIERETETNVVWQEILGALGFRAVREVKKHRTRYRLGDLEVTLDDVEGLGTYAEVEATTDTAAPDAIAQVQETVLAAVQGLGLGPEETRSYLELLVERGTASSQE